MVKTLLSLLLALAAVTATAAPRVRVGIDRNSAPITFVNAQGRPDGFAVELLREMAQVGGFEVEFLPDYWSANFRRLNNRELEAFSHLADTPSNRAEMDLSLVHARTHAVIYTRSGSAPLRSTADFAGRTIATLVGTAASINAQRQQGWGARVQVYPNVNAAFDAVRRGECDAALFANRPSLFTADEHGLVRGFVDDIFHEYHFAVRKDDAETLAQLNQALATTLHNGSFDRIFSKWIGPIEPHPIRLADLRPYLWPAAATLAAITAFILWQRHMLRRLARQAEALRHSEERWKYALEGESAAVWDWDIARGRVALSPLWKSMLGHAEHEISDTYREWEDRLHPEDKTRVEAALQAHLENPGSPYAVEFRLRCKDGSWKWILGRGLVVSRDAHGKALRMIGTHSDLTARKQAEADRLVLGKLESTGVLAGGIAHDFNNLLTSITLNLDLASNAPETAAPRLRDIRKATLAARDLTHQLITFARGGAPLRRSTHLARLLRESVPLALTGATVRSEIFIAPDLWPAEVDEGQIGQLIRNLVLNAQEAMPRGGVVTLRAENALLRDDEVPRLPAGDYLKITVTDQGGGIPPDVLPSIFDPYFSTKQRGTQKGMGLGLTICHSVAQKHGGAITVETTPDVGTAFHAYLPAKRAAAPTEPAADTQPPPGGGGRVLVMDDEEWMRESVTLALTQLGFRVETAAEGQAAIALFQQARATGRPFDYVILDLTVRGGMGGQETIRALQAIDPAVQAVVMSGYANNEVLRDHARHGFRSALTKPFSIEDLRQALAA